MEKDRGLVNPCFKCWFNNDNVCELEEVFAQAAAKAILPQDVVRTLSPEKKNELIERGCHYVTTETQDK